MKLTMPARNILFMVLLALTAFGCAGTKVNFADVSLDRLDLTRGRNISASASGFQLLLFIPIGVNGRQAEAYARLQQAAGTDRITDIKVQESWTYAFVGTVYRTTMTATAYPEKTP
jgi:hypothetical protein